MTQKNKYLKFKKDISNNNLTRSQQDFQNSSYTKKEITKKNNTPMSSFKKENIKQYAHPHQNSRNNVNNLKKNRLSNQNEENNLIPQHIFDRENSEISHVERKNITNNKNPQKTKETKQQPTNHLIKEKTNYNVDEILADLIPDYKQELSIEVNHVDLTFDVTTDKIDNLKEQIIRTIKRNKSKTIKFQALKDINFKIYKGEKVGIIGYNGAGKSTLLNVICGIYPPDKGNVNTYGRISPLLSLGAGFDYNYSGAKNIFLNGAVLGYDKKFLKEKFDEIVEFSELNEFINFPIKNYSSGMLAKLGFSIATLVEPDILIIDEILGVGDVNFQRKSSDKIRSLMDSGTTVILVSHSIPQIRELCDKAIWIDNGIVKAIGEVNQICDLYLKDAERANSTQIKNIRLK